MTTTPKMIMDFVRRCCIVKDKTGRALPTRVLCNNRNFQPGVVTRCPRCVSKWRNDPHFAEQLHEYSFGGLIDHLIDDHGISAENLVLENTDELSDI